MKEKEKLLFYIEDIDQFVIFIEVKLWFYIVEEKYYINIWKSSLLKWGIIYQKQLLKSL